MVPLAAPFWLVPPVPPAPPAAGVAPPPPEEAATPTAAPPPARRSPTGTRAGMGGGAPAPHGRPSGQAAAVSAGRSAWAAEVGEGRVGPRPPRAPPRPPRPGTARPR